MDEQDRFAVYPEPGNGAAERCRRRDGCRASIYGDLPQEGRGRSDEARPRVFDTSELSALEEAVVKILPRWREAYEAVIAYARELAGFVPPSGGGIPNGFVPGG